MTKEKVVGNCRTDGVVVESKAVPVLDVVAIIGKIHDRGVGRQIQPFRCAPVIFRGLSGSFYQGISKGFGRFTRAYKNISPSSEQQLIPKSFGFFSSAGIVEKQHLFGHAQIIRNAQCPIQIQRAGHGTARKRYALSQFTLDFIAAVSGGRRWFAVVN